LEETTAAVPATVAVVAMVFKIFLRSSDMGSSLFFTIRSSPEKMNQPALTNKKILFLINIDYQAFEQVMRNDAT
jgi:hypothetical protein